MTQKEYHQALNSIHDPNDPGKCCFRGPIFNPNKNIRETVLQYNLKHPEIPNHSSTKEGTPKVTKTPPPADLTEVSTPPPQCSHTQISIPSETINMQHDHQNKTSTEISLQHDDSPTKTIDSLIQYIENMETSTSLKTRKTM